MVLRDPSGVVADSLNYGALVDPWAAEGYQAASGARLSGCYAPAPGSGFELWSIVVSPTAANTSTGRFPNGVDTDSNCTDFQTQGAATLAAPSPAGATNIKVTSVEDFDAGQTVHIGSGDNLETATVATVGTAGAATVRTATAAGATVLPVAHGTGFSRGQTITIDSGANSDTAVISAIRNFGVPTLTLASPLKHPHTAGVQISGSGISLTTALAQPHPNGAQVSTGFPTPGAPNRYEARRH